MKTRKIYYSRKKGKIVCEGKQKKRTIYLFTIPAPEKLVNSSLFTQEKQAKINEKINRLDYKDQNKKKRTKKFQ